MHPVRPTDIETPAPIGVGGKEKERSIAGHTSEPDLIFFDFIPWKPTDTWPRDRCGRAQLVLLPSLVDFLHLGADL